MNFDFITLFLTGTAYLSLLFFVAYAAERRLLPDWLVNHPAVYILSVAVFVGAFGIYGIVEFARLYGYGHMQYYAGISAVFLVAPLLLNPLMMLCRNYRLSSLADLLTFRFRSQWVGSLVTMTLLFTMLPLLTLQIQAVSESLLVMTGRASAISSGPYHRDILALVICAIISSFTILFGSRHLNSRESHRGLITALALESIVKLAAILVAGIFSVLVVFDGFEGLQNWLTQQSVQLESLNNPGPVDRSRMMLVMFFAAAVCLPHVFHVLFAENPKPRNLKVARWAVPLYAVLISLPVFPILWAGESLQLDTPPDYFALALGLHTNNRWMAQLVFIGGLSAASGTIIVSTLALASMTLNHLVLPLYQPGNKVNIYAWLLWIRRFLIVVIILAGYLFYHLIPERHTLSELGLIAFSGSVQFLPGILSVVYWSRANSYGLIAGILTGLTIWAWGALAPLTEVINPRWIASLYGNEPFGTSSWVQITAISLMANTFIFILVSLLTRAREEEAIAAKVCSMNELNRPVRQLLDLKNVDDMQKRLAVVLGNGVAQREIYRALDDIKLKPDERRPYALRRLRDRLEINLSGLMGPGVARTLIDQQMPYTLTTKASGEDITFIESRLEQVNTQLTGLAADLDNLRRHHRQTLDELPIGLCSIDDGEIVMWNRAMADLSGIPGDSVTGSRLSDLENAWRDMLSNFVQSEDLHWRKYSFEDENFARVLNLHKAAVNPAARSEQVIVVEDVTETHLMENKLTHQERLASIGRLAAGVAHEIGNPVTGIACLAQNLRYETDEDEILDNAEQIIKQTQRITSIVQSLVNFAHQGRDTRTTALEPVNIKDCVNEAIQLLSLDREAKQVSYDNQCPPELIAAANNQRLIQVFINLLANARDASEEHGRIEVVAYADEKLHMRIIDKGSGIPAEALEHIFEPFFTTKDPGKGTGLGLALVYNIIEDLEGEIRFTSPLPHLDYGTAVELILPLHR